MSITKLSSSGFTGGKTKAATEGPMLHPKSDDPWSLHAPECGSNGLNYCFCSMPNKERRELIDLGGSPES